MLGTVRTAAIAGENQVLFFSQCQRISGAKRPKKSQAMRRGAESAAPGQRRRRGEPPRAWGREQRAEIVTEEEQVLHVDEDDDVRTYKGRHWASRRYPSL